jgi:hypothetical protein
LPAAIYLTHAFAVFMEETMIRAGHPDQGELHRQAGQFFQEQMPLSDELHGELAEVRAEFTRLDTREVPTMPLNGFHMALLDPGSGDPDDPELIEVQTNFARRHLRLSACTTAIRLTLSEKQLAKVEADLFTIFDTSWDGLVWDQVTLRAWTETAEQWRNALAL